MTTTEPTLLTEERLPTLLIGKDTLAAATENALTIKRVYDVKNFQDLVLRILNTHGSNSFDYYIEASVLDSPDDTTPASDWFTVSDIDGVALTNITLAAGAGHNRIINVLPFSFIRIRTENTTTNNNSSLTVNTRATIRRIT